MATRIYGNPGHLIVEARPPSHGDNWAYAHDDDREMADRLYNFLAAHVSYRHVIKRVVLLLTAECSDWVDAIVDQRDEQEAEEREREEQEEEDEND